MYELVQLAQHSYYIDCPAKIGIVKTGESEVIAIDSGSDKDAGKKVLRVLKENGWTLQAVLNTHSHADHIGGNKYLQDQTRCRIFAPGIECDYTNHPILEPALLYGGFPPKDLRHKFLMAAPSAAEPLSEAVLPKGMQIIELPGHSYDMVGFRTQDDVVYLADCLSSQETIEKYGVGYLVDVEAQLKTLEKVRTLQGKCFVPAHAPAVGEIASLAQYNIDAVMRIGEKICALCEEPVCFDVLLKKLFEAFDMKMNMQQHALIGSTLKSYLTWLENRSQIEHFIEDNMLFWRRTGI